MASHPNPPKLLPARARVSTALQQAALQQATRDTSLDEDRTKPKRRRQSSPSRTLASALQSLTGRF